MDTSIFYDIRKCKSDMPIKIIIGPRGCGKTYSVLDYMQEKSSVKSKFIYMRRDGFTNGATYEEIIDIDVNDIGRNKCEG